jgi:hypothetical protein
MVSTLLFLSFMALDGADLSRALRVGGMSHSHCLAVALPVVGTIRAQGRQPTIGLLQQCGHWSAVPDAVVGQGGGDDLAALCVDRQVQLTPDPVPRWFSQVTYMDPQPCAVDEQM